MTNKTTLALSTALLLTVSMASAYAEEGDLTATQTMEQVRAELNLQAPESENAQARVREQTMDQANTEYQNMNNAGTNTMYRQNSMGQFMRGTR